MKEIIDSLYINDPNYELYQGVVESLEGLKREFGVDNWKECARGTPYGTETIRKLLCDAGLHAV